ncbi:membrane protein insertion efficiency factor YidD [Candidatus Dojkabacteria bacterium]|uniref:Putative membrane protein insertion efficiency factor n=1 Tax=Candidatus Dojkabacteria bacterium TaxID=2099670 RepID=A0A955L9I5_9BACT|nr:membrane protein insertion efficiency factor YidD [Candidatus Dojkabacteria bacterium]
MKGNRNTTELHRKKILQTPKRVILFLIRMYQKTLSFDHSYWGKRTSYRVCVHYPSCSEYAYGAIEKHGVCKGVIMGSMRVLRCTPFARHRYDPVPETFMIKANPVDSE